MEFDDAVYARRTVREFKPDPVPPGSIRRVLRAGLQAPCNAHLKSWRFLLLRDKEKRAQAVIQGLRARDIKDPGEIERFLAPFADDELKSVYRRSLPLQLTMMLEAPELLVVCYQAKPLADCRRLFDLNPLASVWMCIENIMLALAAEGLHGCTYTPYEAGGLKEFLGIPEGYEIAAVIPFGFSKQEPKEQIPEKLDGRLSIDKWGNFESF
jgi:nitroreductase